MLFSGVAELEDADDIKPRSKIMLRHNKLKDFIFFILMLYANISYISMYIRIYDKESNSGLIYVLYIDRIPCI